MMPRADVASPSPRSAACRGRATALQFGSSAQTASRRRHPPALQHRAPMKSSLSGRFHWPRSNLRRRTPSTSRLPVIFRGRVIAAGLGERSPHGKEKTIALVRICRQRWSPRVTAYSAERESAAAALGRFRVSTPMPTRRCAADDHFVNLRESRPARRAALGHPSRPTAQPPPAASSSRR